MADIPPIAPGGHCWPNQYVRDFLLAFEAVCGLQTVNATLGMAGLEKFIGHYPPDNMLNQVDYADISMLNAGIESLYGRKGGFGIAYRAGRAMVAQGYDFVFQRFQDSAFQALSLELKLQQAVTTGLLTLIPNIPPDTPVVFEEPERYLFVMQTAHGYLCPACYGRHADPRPPQRTAEMPICHMLRGIIYESLYRMTGHEFPVTEIACMAQGQEKCVFAIGKQPVNVDG